MYVGGWVESEGLNVDRKKFELDRKFVIFVMV